MSTTPTYDGKELRRQTCTGDGSRPEHVRTTDMTAELPLGHYAPGRWGWLLADVQQTAPIPCKGRQGVFRLDPETAAALSLAPVPGDGEGTESRT